MGLTIPPCKNPIVEKPIQNSTGLINQWRPKNELRICTWNVLSLYRPRALKLLVDQLVKYKADITALQEVRWINNGVIDKKEYTMYYSCGAKHQFGTGFIVNRKIKHLVIGFTPVNERISCLRIKGKFSNYSIINIHAPTEEKCEEEKDTFYNLLENTYDTCPRYDVKIVIGDANAQIGKEELFVPVIGKHSLHESSNGNGLKLIDFATSRGMVIGSTLFPHKKIHKGTWKSPDNQTINQIDHILIESKHKSMLEDCRTFRGANIDSDHFLVATKIKAKITNYKKYHGQELKKYNINILKKEDKSLQYKNDLNKRLDNLTHEGIDAITNINEYWNLVKNQITTTAESALGIQKKERVKEWFDEECEQVTKEKNEKIGF